MSLEQSDFLLYILYNYYYSKHSLHLIYGSEGQLKIRCIWVQNLTWETLGGKNLHVENLPSTLVEDFPLICFIW